MLRLCIGLSRLTLSEPHVDVAVDLFKALAQLLDLIGLVFQASGQIAHLLLEPIHTHLHVDGDIAAALGAWRRFTSRCAIDLALEHTEIAFQPIQSLLGGGVLRLCHRTGNCEEHKQRGRPGLQQNSSLSHQQSLLSSEAPSWGHTHGGARLEPPKTAAPATNPAVLGRVLGEKTARGEACEQMWRGGHRASARLS
jgi:hypothetical protein